jgi:hypothetical protein
MGCGGAIHCQCRKVSLLCTANNHAIDWLLTNPNSIFRNIQITKIRELFLSAKYPTVQLARFILEKEALGGEEPEVVETLRDTIPDIQSLQAFLFSDRMYHHQEIYNKWCCVKGLVRCLVAPSCTCMVLTV